MPAHDLPPAFVRQVAAVVGDDHVLVDPDLTAPFAVDWTGRFRGETPMVVRPGSTAEVAAVVAACCEHGVAVVPQGGNTGLVGGGVPLGGELVMSLRRLRRLDPVDRAAAQVTVGAGVTLAELHAHAAAAGLAYAVDLAARDSATVGGNVATNAGGMHVVRHGGTRHQLLGVEAVLAPDRVISRLDGLVKDNTGYDLAGLLCGSEGTLGVVTAARLRLVPRPAERAVALVGLPDLVAVVDLVARWRSRFDTLEAAELMVPAGIELVCGQFDLPHPIDLAGVGAVVLVELADDVDCLGPMAEALADEPAVVASALASSAADRARLWRYREDHTLAINALGPPHKFDVTLPAARLAEFGAAVPGAVAEACPQARPWLFGHVGDGNLHVNVSGVPADADEVLDGAVYGLVVELGGSISAEHGIGTAKRPWLPWDRSPAELDAFRAIKQALDPAGILNPNALVPPEG